LPRSARAGSPAPDLRWAVYYEAESLGDPTPERLAADLRYLADTFFGSSAYLRVGGKPVVFVYAGPSDGAGMAARWAEARALVGGEKMEGSGYFYRPTVLGSVPEDATLLKEEIFGPVAPVASFDSEEAAVAAANDTEFGLVAYVYTSDLKRALRVCEGLQTGMVGLNQGMVSNASAPFGGIKHSGFGREGGAEGIEEYLETKYIAINL